MKTMACSCGFKVTGETEEDVLEQMSTHTKLEHPAQYQNDMAMGEEERSEMLKAMISDE